MESLNKGSEESDEIEMNLNVLVEEWSIKICERKAAKWVREIWKMRGLEMYERRKPDMSGIVLDAFFQYWMVNGYK